MSSEFSAERIAALACKWDEVEGLVKRGEHACKKVIDPAINELRYAGRRFIDAYRAHLSGDVEEIKKHVEATDDCLNRAKHEIVDTILYFTSKSVKALRDRIGEENALNYFKDYDKLLVLIQKIERQTRMSRESREERESFYSEMLKEGGDLWRLCELSDAFSACAPAIEKTVRESKRKERRNLFFAFLGFATAVISFVSRLF